MIWIEIITITLCHLSFILLHMLSFIIVTFICKWPDFYKHDPIYFLSSFSSSSILFISLLDKVSITFILLVIVTFKILIWESTRTFIEIFHLVLPFFHFFSPQPSFLPNVCAYKARIVTLSTLLLKKPLFTSFKRILYLIHLHFFRIFQFLKCHYNAIKLGCQSSYNLLNHYLLIWEHLTTSFHWVAYHLNFNKVTTWSIIHNNLHCLLKDWNFTFSILLISSYDLLKISKATLVEFIKDIFLRFHTLMDQEKNFPIFLLRFLVNSPLHLYNTFLQFLNVILYNFKHF